MFIFDMPSLMKSLSELFFIWTSTFLCCSIIGPFVNSWFICNALREYFYSCPCQFKDIRLSWSKLGKKFCGFCLKIFAAQLIDTSKDNLKNKIDKLTNIFVIMFFNMNSDFGLNHYWKENPNIPNCRRSVKIELLHRTQLCMFLFLTMI